MNNRLLRSRGAAYHGLIKGEIWGSFMGNFWKLGLGISRTNGWILAGILLCSFAAWTPTAVGAVGDYLSPDLRARVEKLKADVAYLPTDQRNMAERARILWQWANAWALNEGVLPVNLTQSVAAIAAYPDLTQRMPAQIDAYIYELTLLDERPDALGTLAAELGPFEARTYVTIRQTYTVGTQDIEPGGGFVVARHFMPNYGIWQTSDPKADNYISIASSKAGVSFAVDSVPIAGMHGGFRGQRPALMFRLATGTLSQGDTVTLTYGDKSQGSQGFLMADFASDRMPLPLYLAFDSDTPLLTLPIQPVVVTGTRFAGLAGFAPSVVAPGESFVLSARGQDIYYNRSIDGHPALRVLNGDQTIARIPASREPISLIDLTLDEPGIYHLRLESRDGKVSGEVNPILVTAENRDRIFWGDTHGHSGFAEGIGTPDSFMIWARDDARLDYVTHSEHDIWMDDYEWEVLRDNVRRYTEEGAFIAYLGYEWTVRNFNGGHHNVLFRTPDARDRVPAQFFPTLSKLYQGLRATADPEDVVIIPHAHQAGDYRQNDPELEPLIEIMSQHGNFEWFGRMYLEHGHQVGFVAASDNHLSQPGYGAPKNASLAQRGGLGAILARERTTDGIFDGMKALKAYATTGDRIILDVSLNGTGMGQRAPFAAERSLMGRVIGTAPIEHIAVIKNDALLWEQDYLTATEPASDGTATYLLSFASEAAPYHPGDNPRGWRHWRGTLEIENAEIEGFQGMDFHNSFFQSITPDPENPNRLQFATHTRGDTSSIELRLRGIKRSTSLSIELEEARETGGGPPVYRRHQVSPAGELVFPFREMTSGRLERTMATDVYTDTVLLRQKIENGPRVISFEVSDESEQQGDYYFVRVRQANDAMAWSSPIWVGGYQKQ